MEGFGGEGEGLRSVGSRLIGGGVVEVELGRMSAETKAGDEVSEITMSSSSISVIFSPLQFCLVAPSFGLDNNELIESRSVSVLYPVVVASENLEPM